MHNGWMRTAYQSICTESSQGMRYRSQRAPSRNLAPRRHVLTPPSRPPLHPPHRTTPHSAALAHAGCNPEFSRPRTPSTSCFDDRSLARCSSLSHTAICRSLAELRARAVISLMIKVETHAGTVSLLSTNAASEFGSYAMDANAIVVTPFLSQLQVPLSMILRHPGRRMPVTRAVGDDDDKRRRIWHA